MIRYFNRFLSFCKWIVYYSLYYSKFKKFGNSSYLNAPLLIQGAQNIEVGENVAIQYKVWLACVGKSENKKLVIEDGCRIGNFNHIYAISSIVIEKSVLTADKVYISDNIHTYDDVDLPILAQQIKFVANVTIGEGAWLGENVCVIGANVGKHSVIGANSVVTKDIPDYCVAVGAPAKIIKRYNFQTNSWERTNSMGERMKNN